MNGIYVQTNQPENRALAFRREEDGSLMPLGGYGTGGAGDGVPHLTSQGSVVLTGDGRHLLVTNAGSGDVGVFAVGRDGLERWSASRRTGRRPGRELSPGARRPGAVRFGATSRRPQEVP